MAPPLIAPAQVTALACWLVSSHHAPSAAGNVYDKCSQLPCMTRSARYASGLPSALMFCLLQVLPAKWHRCWAIESIFATPRSSILGQAAPKHMHGACHACIKAITHQMKQSARLTNPGANKHSRVDQPPGWSRHHWSLSLTTSCRPMVCSCAWFHIHATFNRTPGVKGPHGNKSSRWWRHITNV